MLLFHSKKIFKQFRVEIEVENDNRTTTFVLFDRDVRKLTHTTAEEISASEETKGEESSVLKIIPQCLTEIIGKTMEFQIKITEFNFKASNQTFTVYRITKENLLDDSDDTNKSTKVITMGILSVMP